MVQKRHPDVAHLIIGEMHQDTRSESIRGVVECEGILQSVGFDVPTWTALAQGAHPFNPEGDEDSTAPRAGWQRPATSRLHEECVSEMWPAFSDTEKALMLSQSGPMCGEPFTCFPTTRETRFDSQSFRLLLLRRLRLPLPFTARRCRCGRPLDPCGHHRAACARVGVLGRRGFALESAAARVCREAGGRVMTNMLVRDMDLAPGANHMADGRRLEVVVDGLSLFHGAQLAIDTTLVSAVRADGTPRPRAARKGGAALDDARARKEVTYPELVGEGSRAKLVVLAAEVGGRWSAEAAQFIRALAASKATSAPEFMQASVAHAWCHRWRRLLACSAAKAFAGSLLEHRSPVSAAGVVPSVHDVIRDGLHVR